MLTSIKDHLFNLAQPLRFLIAGILNTVFAYILFAAGLFALTIPLLSVGGWVQTHYYLIIQWLMWVLSVPFGAFTLKYYAFQSAGPYLQQAMRSYGVYLPAQLLSSALLIVFVRLLSRLFPGLTSLMSSFDATVLVAQLCAVACATVVSYFGHQYFTFRQST